MTEHMIFIGLFFGVLMILAASVIDHSRRAKLERKYSELQAHCLELHLHLSEWDALAQAYSEDRYQVLSKERRELSACWTRGLRQGGD